MESSDEPDITATLVNESPTRSARTTAVMDDDLPEYLTHSETLVHAVTVFLKQD